MSELPDDRNLVLRARSHLEEWTTSALTEAYPELFEADEPLLSPEDLWFLDALDSRLERQAGDWVWGTDQHGVHTAGSSREGAAIGVVCVYHPQIIEDSVLRGSDDLDDKTEERLDAALWRYGERVAALVDAKLREFVDRTQS